MKYDSRNIGLIMVTVAVISVGATFAVMQGTVLQTSSIPNSHTVASILGHVQVVVHDEAGNIIAYRQADNAVVSDGMQIIASQLFTPGGATGNHTNDTAGRLGWMNVGNGNLGAPAAADTNLDCPLEKAADCGLGYTSQAACIPILSEISSTDPYTEPGGGAQLNVTAVATFDGGDCTSKAIREAGMWNNNTAAGNGDMFARNTFGDVTLTGTDSLELTWRFTFTDSPFP